MRVLELFNKLTLGHKLLVFNLALALSVSAQAQEMAKGTSTLSDKQFTQQTCNDYTSTFRNTQKEFSQACATAGLGKGNACKEKLKKCEKSKNKYRYCVGSAISRADHREDMKEKEEKRKVFRKKETLLADYQEKQDEIQRAKESQSEIRNNLQNTLAEIDDAKVKLHLKLENELVKLSDQVASTQDQINVQQLKLREMVVTNSLECRKKALEAKKEYVQITRGRRLTVNQSFGRMGLSRNQAGTLRYNQVLRNCKALYTDTGRRTGFGEQYALQNDIIKSQTKILMRKMIRQEQAKRRVVKHSKITLSLMNEQRQKAMIQAERANFNAQENIKLLNTQRFDIMSQINQVSIDMNSLDVQTSSSQASALVKLGLETFSSRQKANNKEKVEKQSKIEAFNEALGLVDAEEGAEGDKIEYCGDKKEYDEITTELANIDLSGSADTTTATATEINTDSKDRAPSATVGQTM